MANKARRATRKKLEASQRAETVRNQRGMRVYTSTVEDEDVDNLPDPVGFELDGFEYICRELSPIDISAMARVSGMENTDPRVVGFMAEFFEIVLGEEQFALFRQRCRQFNVREETLMRLVEGIFEDFSDRPTGRRSDSSDTPTATDTTSTDDYSEQAIRQLEAKKRPDLAVAVLQKRRSDEN